MKFRVKRTSIRCDDQQTQSPCEEATSESYTKVDYLPDKQWVKVEWYEEGSNHRTKDGFIFRDLLVTGWFLEIDTLEELLAFQEKYRELVILKDYDHDGQFILEIYDDHRE